MAYFPPGCWGIVLYCFHTETAVLHPYSSGYRIDLYFPRGPTAITIGCPRWCPKMSSEYLEEDFNDPVANSVYGFSEQEPEQKTEINLIKKTYFTSGISFWVFILLTSDFYCYCCSHCPLGNVVRQSVITHIYSSIFVIGWIQVDFILLKLQAWSAFPVFYLLTILMKRKEYQRIKELGFFLAVVAVFNLYFDIFGQDFHGRRAKPKSFHWSPKRDVSWLWGHFSVILKNMWITLTF